MNTTAREFLTDKKVLPVRAIVEQDFDIVALLEEYAEIKIKESKQKPVDVFTIEVKNVDCDFEFLRDGLDKICPSFTTDKDTFIFHSADMPLYVKLIKFRDVLKEKNKSILVTKDGF